jgi:hypothetical protein
MSFLDKLNKTPAATATTSDPNKKVNPFAPKKPVATTETKVEETKVEIAKEVVKEEVKVEATQESAVKKPNPFAVKKPEPPKKEEAAPVEEKKEEIVAEEEKKEEAKAEIVEETKPEEAKVEEKKVPVVNNKKGSRNKAANAPKAESKKVEESSEEVIPSETTFPTTLMSYDDAIEAIKSPFVDPAWAKFKAEVQKEYDDLKIEQDMNDPVLKMTLNGLSKLRSRIWKQYNDSKTLFEQLSGKEPEGLIERIKKTNLGDGTNDLQRKKAGVEACMSYVAPNAAEPVNLYEILDETRSRYNFLKGIMDSISFKADLLITMNSAIKREQSLMSGSEG